MCKKLIPTYHAQSIYDIDPSFYQSLNIKNILIDLDNTLDSYKASHPSKKALTLIEQLVNYGYNLFIISNNKDHRVKVYASASGLVHLADAKKPFKKRLGQFMIDKELKKEETILIGDQLLTDTLLANQLGISIILTEKIVKEDQWTTKFNRLIDRPIRAYLRKRNLLKEIDYYERG